MAYDKNTWQSGDVVTSAKLNNIENGIANTNGKITATESEEAVTLSASYNDVVAMLGNGVIPFFFMGDETSAAIISAVAFGESEGTYMIRFYEGGSGVDLMFSASSATAQLVCVYE